MSTTTTDPRVYQYISAGAWALIEPQFSPKGKHLLTTLITFLENDVMPAEVLYNKQIAPSGPERWATVPPILEELKAKARSLGLWNLWLAGGEFQHLAGGGGVGISNVEYAVLAEISAHCQRICPEAMNCSAPDTGNMEVVARFGTPAQKEQYLKPLLDGKIRSAFAMTEYGVASSDASNLRNTTARREGNKLILNGHKWWISGAGDPRCSLHVVVAQTDPNNPSKHKRHSIIFLDPKTPGVEIVRPMTVYGYDDAPEGHCEVIYKDVVVDISSIAGGPDNLGRGFEMLQARLGPGRLHHCMRAIGAGNRALDLMLLRVTNPARKTFGKELKDHGSVLGDIARSRAELDAGRLLVLAAAKQIDLHKAKGALKDIGIAKFTVPRYVSDVIDRAIQVHGAEGISQDTPLAHMWVGNRTLRFADGPDEVHMAQVGKVEIKTRVPYLQDRRERTLKAQAQLLRQHKL